MMSKTHLTVGIATALAVIPIDAPSKCAIVVAGGAVGGVIADVDTLNNDYKHDALIGEVLAFVIIGILGVFDYLLHWGIYQAIVENKALAIFGALSFLVMWIVGFIQDHRGFTHSIVSMILYSVSLGLVSIPFGIACFCGYLSHLILDLINKKGIQLFFPAKKKLCLKWCYANKTGNTVLMWIGIVSTAALLVFRIMNIS